MNIDFQISPRRRYSDDMGGPHFEPGMFSPSGKMLRFYKGNSSTQSNPNNSTNVDDSRTAGAEGSIVLGSGSSGQVSVVNQTTDYGAIAAAGDAVSAISQASADATNSALRAVSDASYDANQTAQASVAASERAAYEAGRVAAASAEAAAQAASDAAYQSSQASAAAAASAQRAASDALATNESVSKAALSSNEGVARDALATVEGVSGTAIDSVNRANQSLANTTADVLNFRSKDTEDALALVANVQQSTNDLIRYTNEQFTAKLASNAGDAPQETVQQIVKYVATLAVVAAAVVGFAFAAKKSNN